MSTSKDFPRSEGSFETNTWGMGARKLSGHVLVVHVHTTDFHYMYLFIEFVMSNIVLLVV